MSTTTIYTQDDDGFKVISPATNHLALFQNTGAGSAHASFVNSVTGSGLSDGTDYGIDTSGNARILNHENTGFRLLVNQSDEALDVLSTGLVGIGSTTPTAQLALDAPAGNTSYFRIGSSLGTVLDITPNPTAVVGIATGSPSITRALTVVGPTYIENTTANAFSVGAAGTTTRSFNIDSSAGLGNGVNITTTAAGSGVTLSSVSANVNEVLSVASKGSSNLQLVG